MVTREQAIRILGDAIGADGGLYRLGWSIGWNAGAMSATLDGTFTADELEAIAWWLRNQAEAG